MQTPKHTFALLALAPLAVAPSAFAQSPVKPGLHKPTVQLPPPPNEVDAGGDNVANLGMHHLRQIADTFGGYLKSEPITTPKGLILPQNPAPLGWTINGEGIPGLYLPDLAPPTGDQAALDAKLDFSDKAFYPEVFTFANTDPSGSLDESALDVNGDPIHFNLHYPQTAPESFWLEDIGLEPNAPTDDLEEILDEIIATGSKARIPEALDILLGTNDSGSLTAKAYKGFPLLKYQAARDNTTWDPETRNLTITQLWYGTEIVSDCDMVQVPTEGPYTITWKVRGLGDIGPNRERAFPIDEFTPIPMKKTSNGDFWRVNNWIWKWFDIVEHHDGRKYVLEDLYAAHTGTDAAPSYSELNPGDPRYWLHADRKFHLGSYVGEGDLFDFSRWHTYDLDQNGQIGGFLVDGTDTGASLDQFTNPNAQFNQYGNSEYAVPRINWAEGPFHIPHYAYDSSFATIRKGQGFDQVIRYGSGEAQAGLYNWGWRQHPPRINWIETYSEGQMLPSGAPKDWRFGHKWDEIGALGLAAIGSHAPELIIHDALLAFQNSAGAQLDVDAFADKVEGMMGHVRDRRGLPPVDDIPGFPDANADVNLLYTNFDIYGDRDTIQAKGRLNWREGDMIDFTIHNDDNVTRFFRVVDFGTTDYQYNGTDMGRFDWKPVYGFPQLAAMAWRPPSSKNFGFGVQGLDKGFWVGTELERRGNPLYVDSYFHDPDNFWHAGERDLLHDFQDITGFSGPGFTSETSGPYGAWANEDLAGKPMGDPSLWSWSYGRPIPPNTTVSFQVEMPRAAALNNGAMYIFDPQFHPSAIYTMHPTAEIKPQGLDD